MLLPSTAQNVDDGIGVETFCSTAILSALLSVSRRHSRSADIEAHQAGRPQCIGQVLQLMVEVAVVT